jgi:hypothetical protein
MMPTTGDYVCVYADQNEPNGFFADHVVMFAIIESWRSHRLECSGFNPDSDFDFESSVVPVCLVESIFEPVHPCTHGHSSNYVGTYTKSQADDVDAIKKACEEHLKFQKAIEQRRSSK